ncbi:purine-binding chemotaxis protein CheW [Tistlia consotensis]|uniref:Purine-binding chemotaxis protein CheW n=1 Tax=Tistlia consotensis USBA 355 TaxID=560819 RepID=A0A1Y6CX72_9PROT|nr:chemotaxis protein CheW [Tistlia consotensis]SMF84843.1 purine-binding chemotaxis protein CheW [Tistlia consotensis USBA 355]SNS08473.1 purine-binding chemotaxis protein CheW [Tistlia consotensis]
MSEPSATSGDLQVVTLGIDREVFAVPVEAVLEILDLRPMFRLPEAPAYLAGLIDVRGRAVPVIDLRVKLGLPAAAASESSRILVLEVPAGERRLVLGLVADRVFEVAAFAASQIEPTPDIGVDWRSDYIGGVARRDEGFVVIFDLARLFSVEEVAYLGAKAAAAAAAGPGNGALDRGAEALALGTA